MEPGSPPMYERARSVARAVLRHDQQEWHQERDSQHAGKRAGLDPAGEGGLGGGGSRV